MKFTCNKCNFGAEEEGSVHKHMKSKDIAKQVEHKVAGKKRKVLESSRKESVTKEMRVTGGEEDDDFFSASLRDIFQDKFTSTQTDHDNIEKLLLECEKYMQSDDEDDMEDNTKTEDKIHEPDDKMAKKVKKLEDK